MAANQYVYHSKENSMTRNIHSPIWTVSLHAHCNQHAVQGPRLTHTCINMESSIWRTAFLRLYTKKLSYDCVIPTYANILLLSLCSDLCLSCIYVCETEQSQPACCNWNKHRLRNLRRCRGARVSHLWFMTLLPFQQCFTEAPNHLNQLVLSRRFKATTSKTWTLSLLPLFPSFCTQTRLKYIVCINSLMICRSILLWLQH